MPISKNALFVSAVVILLLVIQTGEWQAAGAEEAGVTGWPMFQHNPAHTGCPDNILPTDYNLLWIANITPMSSPAVANDILYVGSSNNIYALNAFTGDIIWNYPAGTAGSSPAILGGFVIVGTTSQRGVNGVVYVGSEDGNVYALSALTGEKLWNYNTHQIISYSSPAVVDGVVYIGAWQIAAPVYPIDYKGTIYALNAYTGERIWSYKTSGQIHSSPAVVDGVVYIGVQAGNEPDNFYALNATNGEYIWGYHGGKYGFTSSPAVVGGVVYVGSSDSNVYALSALTGEKLWNYTTNDGIVYSSPAVVGGVVYIGSGYSDKNVYAFNASTGEKIWNYTTNGIVYSSPAVVGGVVYIGSYALNATTGEKIWNYTTNRSPRDAPAIVNGVIYTCGVGSVYAFGTPIIPEFPSWIILPLFLIATLFAIIVKKRQFHTRSRRLSYPH